MSLITVEQAATRLNRTPRTIRRWITEGKLSEHHPTHGHTRKFLIESSEVEQLAIELAQYEPPAITEDSHALLERVTQLEGRISDLERLVSGGRLPRPGEAAPVSPERATEASRKLGRPPGHVTTEPPVELPPGSLLAKDFAERHGIKDPTFRDHVLKGFAATGERVETTEIPNPKRNEIKRWLTPEQQRKAILFWQRHGVQFTPCPLCPHSDQSQAENDAPGSP